MNLNSRPPENDMFDRVPMLFPLMTLGSIISELLVYMSTIEIYKACIAGKLRNQFTGSDVIKLYDTSLDT